MINYPEKFKLNNKIAYVTGGLGLLGRQICIALASSGAKTIILDIDNDKWLQFSKELSKAGLQACYEHFDITDLENIDKKIEQLCNKYQGVDVWVNNAYPRTEDWGNDVESLSLDSWQKNVDIHLNAYSWISRKVCMQMKTNGGSLINLGSIYGIAGADFTVYEATEMTCPMAYAAIKGGIINLTRYLASYFGKYNIRVNNICPGGIFDNQNKTFVKSYSNKTPLKRMGNSDEIAAAVLFLACDASSYVSGHSLVVDGGWSIV